MITTGRMNEILGELLTDTKPRQKDTPEEAKFRIELQKDIDNAPEGAVIDAPVDYEFGEDEKD